MSLVPEDTVIRLSSYKLYLNMKNGKLEEFGLLLLKNNNNTTFGFFEEGLFYFPFPTFYSSQFFLCFFEKDKKVFQKFQIKMM